MSVELLEIGVAREAILARTPEARAEQVPIAAALGRVLAAPVTSAEAVPAFDNSAMDGYAVRATDTTGASEASPVTLAVIDESRAGHPARRELGPGEAIAISTGAMVPAGADAVVRLEDTSSGEGAVRVHVPVKPGMDLRRAGEDIEAGDRVLDRGTIAGPAELGVLASIGLTGVACAQRPTVRVVTTGDELHEPGEELRPGGIRNSNAHSLPALAERCGARALATEIVRDDPDPTSATLERALDADVAVVSGGVSVGRHDHVRPALAALGVEEVFWGVALRPGKPTWFGVREAKLAFGLPGNPVSAIVTFLLFIRPAIRATLGLPPEDAASTTAVLDADYSKRPGRAHAVRCRLDLREDGWHAAPTKQQGSHVLTSMVGADALAILPTERESVSAGERVEIVLLPR